MKYENRFIPGNGNSSTDFAPELSVIIIGVFAHLIQTIEMKYIDESITKTKVQAKKHLWQRDEDLVITIY